MRKRSFKPAEVSVDAPAKHPNEGEVESGFEPIEGSRPETEESLPDPRAQAPDPHAHAVAVIELPGGVVLRQF